MTSPLALAADHVERGRFSAALRVLEALPQDLPGRWALLGRAFLGRKQAAPALAALARAAAEAPGDRPILMALGRAHMLAADWGRAAALFEGLLAGAPGDRHAAQALAQAYRADARYDDAIGLVDGWEAPSPQMLYDKALCQARLGDGPASLATCDRLIALAPQLAAAWFASHAPALEIEGWDGAQRRLLAAMNCPKANGRYGALLAAYDVLAGRSLRPYSAKHAHLVDSAAALLPHLAADWRLFGVSASLLRHGLDLARRDGLVLEFGVRRGASLAVIAQAANQDVHGFDSFQGLPESWNNGPAGLLHTDAQRPGVAANVHLHPGWFEDTLGPFLHAHPGMVRFANIDCDIYSSARTVLFALADRIGPGTVLVFDEFIGNRGWRDDEYKAYGEFAAQFGVKATIRAVNLACKQVAMVVDAAGMKG